MYAAAWTCVMAMIKPIQNGRYFLIITMLMQLKLENMFTVASVKFLTPHHPLVLLSTQFYSEKHFACSAELAAFLTRCSGKGIRGNPIIVWEKDLQGID